MTQKNDVFVPPKSGRCMSRKKASEEVEDALKISVADLCGWGREKQTPHPSLTSAWQELPHGIDYVPGNGIVRILDALGSPGHHFPVLY